MYVFVSGYTYVQFSCLLLIMVTSSGVEDNLYHMPSHAGQEPTINSHWLRRAHDLDLDLDLSL